MSGQNQTDRSSTPDFIAGLNLDQLNRCVELANARIQKLKEGDKVEVFVVGDFCNHFATTSRKEALLWIVEAASYCATEDLPCDELSMQSHFMCPRMSAMTYIMRHMRDRGLDVDESPADFVDWEEFYGWFYSDRFVTARQGDQ